MRLGYAGDLDKRWSTTGYPSTMTGGPVCWRLILKFTFALFTAIMEYMTIIIAFKEAIWIHGLINNLGISQEHIQVFCDSQSVIVCQRSKSNVLILSILMFDFIFEKLLMKETFVYWKLKLMIIVQICWQR